MLKLSTTFFPVTALSLAALWCWTSGEGALLASQVPPSNRVTEPASLAALPTGQLIATLGEGGPGEGVQICVEIARRFHQASPADRANVLSQLGGVLESNPQPDSRAGAIACLAGLTGSPSDQATQTMIAEMMRNVLSADREPRILAAAIRLLPDVDRSQSALDLLSALLNNRRLLQAHPELAREALLSAGRLGPLALPLLEGFLPTHPEASMIGLSATGSEEAVRVLVREAGGADPERRSLAVHALGLCAGSEKLSEETHALITRTLESVARADSDPDIRQKAIEWLSRSSQ